ncbi:hypothetical protein HPE56_09645 [Maribacter sp. ANRC-HE7]|uniref:Lipoprotein n=1 Tax=Maribacter aquimaris TaxID=2737171 RepID=A0ABR7V424_9FLAO|nr:hypothetical protein [Maribacter aquimaris]MBD0778056.1 hypothetical protein [Maribacter aquimaris]
MAFSSCNSDNDSNNDDDQDFKVGEYTLKIDGVTATEFIGEISVCPDGYFIINGTAPDESNLTIQSSKILVGETRSFCDVRYLEEGPYNTCMENDGFSVGGVFMGEVYTSAAGSATRTSTNDIIINCSVWYMSDPLVDHSFTLEATANLVSRVNCE